LIGLVGFAFLAGSNLTDLIGSGDFMFLLMMILLRMMSLALLGMVMMVMSML